MDGEWVGGRHGSSMFCPQTWLLSYPSAGPWETFSRCQSGIHAPSVTIPVAVLILTGEGGGEQPLSGLPLPPSHPASTPKQLTESPWLFPMEISPMEPRGGGNGWLSSIHLLPVRTGMGKALSSPSQCLTENGQENRQETQDWEWFRVKRGKGVATELLA